LSTGAGGLGVDLLQQWLWMKVLQKASESADTRLMNTIATEIWISTMIDAMYQSQNLSLLRIAAQVMNICTEDVTRP
jgi:hypothetical protein